MPSTWATRWSAALRNCGASDGGRCRIYVPAPRYRSSGFVESSRSYTQSSGYRFVAHGVGTGVVHEPAGVEVVGERLAAETLVDDPGEVHLHLRGHLGLVLAPVRLIVTPFRLVGVHVCDVRLPLPRSPTRRSPRTAASRSRSRRRTTSRADHPIQIRDLTGHGPSPSPDRRRVGLTAQYVTAGRSASAGPRPCRTIRNETLWRCG